MKTTFLAAKLLKIGHGEPFCRVQLLRTTNLKRATGTSKKSGNDYDISTKNDVQEIGADPSLFQKFLKLEAPCEIDITTGSDPENFQRMQIIGINE